MQRKNLVWILFGTLALFLLPMEAAARSVRLDSGDWLLSGFVTGSSTESLGFDFEMLGVTANAAQIDANGSVTLSGGTGSATLMPFFDATQGGAGNTAQYQFGVTNPALFNTPGVEAGFRVSWTVFDVAGALVNEYQLSLFELTGGLFALEFNYNAILAGSDASQIGFNTSFGDAFDLTSVLGLAFADLAGVGDDDFASNCLNTPNALACNNFYGNTLAFGPDALLLPDFAGGFFRNIDSNGGDVQGRYLWVFGADAQVSAPGPLLLVLIGAAALFVARRAR